MVLATMELMSFVNTPYPLKHAKQLSKKSLYEKKLFHHHHHHLHHHQIFIINMQVQGQYPHQWAPLPDSWLAAHMADLVVLWCYATMELMSFVNTPYPLKHAKQL